jgi:hypothetical protein
MALDFVDPIYYYVLSIDGTGAATFPGLPYCLQTANTTPTIVPTASPSTMPVAVASAPPSNAPVVVPTVVTAPVKKKKNGKRKPKKCN